MAGASDRASAGSHSWAVAGTAWVEVDGETRECRSVCVFSPLGVETWLSVDKETGELLYAEQIDGEWVEVDLDWAREEFADVLHAVARREDRMSITDECELVRDDHNRVVCDKCGRPQAASITTAADGRAVVVRLDAYNYCPNCGRRITNPTYGEFMDGGRK